MLIDNVESKYTDFQIPVCHKTKLKIYNWKESIMIKKKDQILSCIACV